MIMLTDTETSSVRRTVNWSATWGGRFLSLCLVLLSAGLTYGATDAAPKLSTDLQGRRATEHIDVIIQYRNAPTAVQHQKVARQGGTLQHELGVVKAASYNVPASALESLAADPDVAYIAPDRALSITATTSQVLDYYEATINSPYAWGLGLNGAGIGVAVIDSGIASPLPDIANNPGGPGGPGGPPPPPPGGPGGPGAPGVVYSQNFLGPGPGQDQYGHGTHVMGIIAGDGSASTGPPDFYTIRGIAENVSLLNLRVLDQNGNGTDSLVISAIQTAIQLKNTYNIRIINLSLGRPVYESYTLDPLCQAVEQAWKAGIVVVVAAGNDGRDNSAGTNGYGTTYAPGNDPYVITVGAMNTLGQSNRSNDVIASYSSKGPTLYDHIVKPDLVAPGNQIISLYAPPTTLNQLYPGNEAQTSLYQNGPGHPSPTYFILSGTSMATPMVTGAVALMLQRNPSLTPDQVKARLMKTAYKNLVPYSTATDPTTGDIYYDQADIFTVGAGLLDIQAALNNTDLAPAAPGSALSPTASQDSSGNMVLTGSPLTVWGTGVWGNTVVWGVSVLTGTDPSGMSVLWGSTVCWGNATMQGFSVVWGNTVVWGVYTPGSEATTLAIAGDQN